MPERPGKHLDRTRGVEREKGDISMLDDIRIESFADRLRGDVIEPDDPRFGAVRSLYNSMIDKRPRLIARCADVADVIDAVRFGRASGLPTAIRGGGHNGPGLA